MLKLFKINLISLFVLFVFIGCSTEKKFANEFVRKSSQIQVMVLSPEFIYKNNLNTNIVDSLGITEEIIRDSLLWEQSDFLKEINDSLLIANYILGYKSELGAYNIRVIDEENANSLMSLDSNAYMINLAQIEIEEEDYEYRDETQIYDYVYYHDHLFTALNINSWFEINMINDNIASENIFYTTNTITDDLTSSYNYNMFSSQVEYIYEVDSLNLSKIYEYTYLLGRIYATYTFDFIMNRYIEEKKGFPIAKSDLLRYNPNTRSFIVAGKNRFISLDE